MDKGGVKVASDNLIPMNERTKEEQRKIATMGGIASGEARREKKAMREMLELCLSMTDDETGKTYKELATLGLIKGAASGNAQNYRTILETLGELNAADDDKKKKELSKVEELLTKLTDEAQK